MFDLIIIGGGPGGYVAALEAGRKGLKTLLIEKDSVGGVCLNRGCIPTKSILFCSNNYKKFQGLKRFGIEAKEISIDENKVTQHRQQVVKTLVMGVENLLKDRKIEIIKGEAEVIDRERVLVNNKELKAKNILLATGSIPSDIPPARFTQDIIVSADKALSFPKSPNSILIVGAGVIGLEMATYYSQIGKKVYIVEILDKVLPAINDEEISKIISRSLKKLKVKLFLSSKLETTKIKDNKILCKIEGIDEFQVDKVLLATGRKPNTKAFKNLSEIINHNGTVKINNRCRTPIDNIYACGDITGEPYLAHKASYQGEIAIANITGEDCFSDLKALPSCVFTTPHIAQVGISLNDTTNDNIVGTYPYSAMGKAIATGVREGFVRIIGNAKDNKVVGAQIVGESADLLIQSITLAIRCGLKVEDIAETIHIHPSLSEIVLEAAKDAIGKPLHKKIN